MKKNIVLKKFIKIFIWMGVIFLFDILWLVTIMIDAPKEATNAKRIPSIFSSSVEGLKAKKSPIKVVINKNLINFLIFSLVIKIEIIKTIIG